MQALKSRAALHLAFFLSGASGLVYEVVWSRQLAVLVGGTAPATQAVLATFFVGMTAGAFWLGPRAAASPHGPRFYARLEIGIAAAGVLSAVILAALATPLAAITDGSDGAATAAIALTITMVACLPATFLMGATFPAVVRALETKFPSTPSAALLGGAYAANTLGAVGGSLAGAFLALPYLGARGTLASAVVGNLVAAALAWFFGRSPGGATVTKRASSKAPRPSLVSVETLSSRWLAIGLVVSGFAAISLEVVALRVLAVILSDSVYTFALVIAAYIAGAALCAALLAKRPRLTAVRPSLALAVAALACALWLPMLRLGAPLLFWARNGFQQNEFIRIVAAEFLVAICLAMPIALPTTWLFLTFAARAAAAGGRPPGTASGAVRATAYNGIGCAVAPLVSSLLVLPQMGTLGLAGVAIGSLALLALALSFVASKQQRISMGPVLIALALAAAAVVLVRDGLYDWTVTPGWRILWAKEGAGATVSVEESPEGQRRLRTNNNFSEGGDVGGIGQIRQGMLPTLFQPDARRVLVLGIGSGVTLAGVVAGLPEATFDAVELLPEIRHAIGLFSRTHGGIEKDPRVALHVADARTFTAHAAARGEHYGLVVGDLFHAAQAGTGTLYSREHFRAVRRLIGGGGLYCQWLPLHETPPDEVRTVVRTFFGVFPKGAAFLGGWELRGPILGLIGSDVPLTLDWDATAARLQSPRERSERASFSELNRLDETLATFVADAETMRRWAGLGPENTDDRPELELGAPRGVRDTLGPDNLFALETIRQSPEGWVNYRDPARKEATLAIQKASGALIRGLHAWTKNDLAGAEAELRQAVTRAPAFAPAQNLAYGLSEAWGYYGDPARGAALAAWLSTQKR